MRPSLRLGLFLAGVLAASLLLTPLVKPLVDRFADYPALKIFRRLVTVLAGIGMLIYVKHVLRQPLASLGFRAHGRGAMLLLRGFLLGFVCFAALLLFLCATGSRTFVPVSSGSALIRKALILLPAALLIGCLEESFFRGFLLQQLMREFPTSLSLLLSSLIYSAVHFVKDLDRIIQVVPQAIGLCLLGMLLGAVFLRTGSLYGPIGLHAALVVLMKLSGLLFQFHSRSPGWWYGDERLLSGGLSWSVLITSCLILRWVFPAPRQQLT